MLIERVLEYNPNLKIIYNKSRKFDVMGTINSDSPGLLSYCRDNNNDDLEAALKKKNIVALFAREEDVRDVDSDITFICSETLNKDFHLFQQFLYEKTDYFNRNEPNIIASTARVHPSVVMDDHNIEIGENTEIGPNCTIYANTKIGSDVMIGAGCVIGSESLQLIRTPDGKKKQIYHVGGVVIGDGTYMGVNNVVVRNVWETPPTTIGKNVAIANLVMIGHNVIVEDDAQLISTVVLGGGCVIKKGARVSFGSNVSNRLVVGENAWVTIGSVVTRDVPPGQRVSGNFAIEHRKRINHVKRLVKES